MLSGKGEVASLSASSARLAASEVPKEQGCSCPRYECLMASVRADVLCETKPIWLGGAKVGTGYPAGAAERYHAKQSQLRTAVLVVRGIGGRLSCETKPICGWTMWMLTTAEEKGYVRTCGLHACEKQSQFALADWWRAQPHHRSG